MNRDSKLDLLVGGALIMFVASAILAGTLAVATDWSRPEMGLLNHVNVGAFSSDSCGYGEETCARHLCEYEQCLDCLMWARDEALLAGNQGVTDALNAVFQYRQLTATCQDVGALKRDLAIDLEHELYGLFVETAPDWADSALICARLLQKMTYSP